MSRKPNFFLVGAPKCGTTSLYEYFRQHPDVFMPHQKEPHKFGTDLALREGRPMSDRDYLRLFAPAGAARRVGEASVYYLFSVRAAREIHAFAPDARIVATLRNPVDMLYSWHGTRVWQLMEETLDFEEAFGKEDAEPFEPPRDADYANVPRYRTIASFAAQLERYFDVFGRDRVHVVLFDDLVSDPTALYRRAADFLELDASFVPDFQVHNQKRWIRLPAVTRLFDRFPVLRRVAGRIPRGVRGRIVGAASTVLPSPDRPPLRPAFRAELVERFRPEVDRLSVLLGRDLSHWCAANESDHPT